MDLGSGIAVGTLCVSAGAVFITAICSGKPRENGNGNGKPHPLCAEHSGVKACLDAIQDSSERHEKWLGEISRDVKEILRAK